MTPGYREIGVLLRKNPCESIEATEATRLCVGLILRNPQVHLFLSGEALRAFDGSAARDPGQVPEFLKHLTAFVDMGCPLVVEQEAMETDTVFPGDLGAQVWGRDEIIRFLSQCDQVIVVDGQEEEVQPSTKARGRSQT